MGLEPYSGEEGGQKSHFFAKGLRGKREREIAIPNGWRLLLLPSSPSSPLPIYSNLPSHRWDNFAAL